MQKLREEIERTLDGHPYYMCSQCFLITLDKSTIGDHLRMELSCDSRCREELQCFGCRNVFFTEKSLLGHAIHDHQMTESEAKVLLKYFNNNRGGVCEDQPKCPASGGRQIRILSDIRITSSRRNSETSGAAEENLIVSKDNSPNSKKRQSCEKRGEARMGHKCALENCSVRLLARENLLYHEKCHNPNGEQNAETFKCPECSEFSADNWSKMSGHLWRLHLVDMELYACELCNYKTPSRSKLMSQHRGIHGSERPFVCEHCGKDFKTSKQLRSHRSSHKFNDNDSIECEKCQRVFKNFRLLKLHDNSVHRDCKPFSCSSCDYSASTRSGLKLHLRRHTGEKPFSCDQCDYSTGDHNSLRRHKLRHLGLKPYNCPHCSYACIQSSTYKVHLKNKHPGSDDGLMFSCKHCSYRSLNRGSLLTHVAKHTESAGNNTDNELK